MQAEWWNSLEPDEIVHPSGTVWFGSTLFAQACLSENLGSWHDDKVEQIKRVFGDN